MGGSGSGRPGTGRAFPEQLGLRRIDLADVVGAKKLTACDALRVTTIPRGGSEVETVLPLAQTRTCFGGRRFWLTCPRCVRRRRVLFVAPRGSVACRRCFRLRYFSQSQDAIGRAEHAMAKIVRLLKAEGSSSEGDDLPPKPAGMHWSRYDRLADRYERQSNIWAVATMRRLGVLIPRLRRM